MSEKIDIGYYLMRKGDYNAPLEFIKIIAVTPEENYYVEINGNKSWISTIDKEWSSYMSKETYYIVEHLPTEFAQKIIREDKLKRILKEDET